MKRIFVVCLAFCVVAFSDAVTVAATNATAPATRGSAVASEKAPGKARALPYRGKLAVVNKAARTFQIGQRTFQVTRETKIERDGKPARFEEGTVGDYVTGSYRKGEDGKLLAASLYFGGKQPATPGKQPAKPGQ